MLKSAAPSLSSIISLSFCAILTTIAIPSAPAGAVDIKVKVVSERDAAIGVESAVEVTTGGTKTWHETDREGVLPLTVATCDGTVQFTAVPKGIRFSPLFRSVACAAPETQLPVAPVSFISAIERVLQSRATIADPETRRLRERLLAAMDLGDHATVASLSADISIRLVNAGQNGLAHSYSLVSQASGWKALAMATPDLFPEMAQLPIQRDPKQGLYVMSPEGSRLLTAFQETAGIDQSGQWDGRTLRHLNAQLQ